MIYIGIILILILAILLTVVPHVSNWLKAKRDTVEIHAKVHEDNGKYTFLIDRSLRIKDTNFYELNPELNDGQPAVLGNVLRCQTGCDSGLCGTGISCKNCPVRMILTNSFKLQRDFEDVTAGLVWTLQ